MANGQPRGFDEILNSFSGEQAEAPAPQGASFDDILGRFEPEPEAVVTQTTVAETPAAPESSFDDILGRFPEALAEAEEPAPSQVVEQLSQLPETDPLVKPGTPPTPPPAPITPAGGGVPPLPVDTPAQTLAREAGIISRGFGTGATAGLSDVLEDKLLGDDPSAGRIAAVSALGPVIAPALAGPATLATISKLFEKGAGREIVPENTTEKLLAGASTLAGGVTSGQALARGLGAAAQALPLSTLKQAVLTRLGTSGIMSISNGLSRISTGDRDAKEVAGDIGQSLGAAVVGLGAETVVPAGVGNWVAQVGADLAFDIVTDIGIRKRLKDQSFKEWFITEELPQLAMSIAFASKDLKDGPSFERQRRQTVKELKGMFDTRAKAQGIFDPRDTADIAQAMDVGKSIESVRNASGELVKEKYADLIAEARAQGLVKKGETPDRTELAQRLASKALEVARTDPSRALADTEESKNFLKGMEQNRIEQERAAEKASRPFLERFKEAVVDEKAAVKKELERIGASDAVRQLVLKDGNSAEANRQFLGATRKVDDALGETPEELLSQYIHARRTVEATRIARERGTELKTPELIGEKNSQGFLDRFEANTDPATRGRVLAAAEEYDTFMRSQLDQLLEAGLVSPEAHAALISDHKSYSPRLFIDNIDPATQGVKGERGHDSGVRALAEGSDKAMETDFKQLMAHVAARTQSRVFRNRANQELLDFARSDPENGTVRVRKVFIKEGKLTDAQKAILESPDEPVVLKANDDDTFDVQTTDADGNIKIVRLADEDMDLAPKGGSSKKADIGRDEGVVTVFEGGRERDIVMPKKLADQWNDLPPAVEADVAKGIKFWSGTKLVKALATGINPEFAFRNFFRDMQFAWFNSGQYSKFVPRAALQMMTDYGTTALRARKAKGIRNTDEYKEYIKEGGGLDFLSKQGIGTDVGRRVEATTAKKGKIARAISSKQELARLVGKGKNAAEKIGGMLSWLGETSEIETRLAVRRRAIKNLTDKFESENGRAPTEAEAKQISTEATFIARSMLDFAQGGRVSKAVDNAVPYLNAAIQGTRGSFRAFKNDPVGSSIKAAQLMAMGYGIAQAAQMLIPDVWNSISEEEKARKWIIPLPFKRKDKKGELKGAYIAIPKDQFQQIFAAMGQSWADGRAGKPWGKQITSSLASTIPVDASSSLPPLANAAIAYWGNYDTWRNDKIWQGDPNVSDFNEIQATTPAIARQISGMAQRMGVSISPERLSRATSKMVPTSNPIASGLVDLYDIPFTEQEQKDTISTIQGTPALRSFLRFSRPISPRPSTLQDARRLQIPTEGRIDQDILNEIKQKRQEIADLRAPNKLALDELRAGNPTREEVIDFIVKNSTSKKEGQSLKRRALDRRPELFK